MHAEPLNGQSAREPKVDPRKAKLEKHLMQENRELRRNSKYIDNARLLRREKCKCIRDDAGAVVETWVSLLVLVGGILLYVSSVSLLISLAHIWLHLRTS